MAGAQLMGGKADITIAKKPIANNPAYPPSGPNKKIHKESEAQVKTINIMPNKLKIGIRVKQGENVEQFAIVGKQPLVLVPAPPQESPANNPVALDLATALGVGSDEKWVTYTTATAYDPTIFGKQFATKLVLNPFKCHPNGVRVFMVAITYETLTFTNGHYVYGISILPGENSKAFPINFAPPGPSKQPAGKKKASKKAPKRRKTPKRR